MSNITKCNTRYAFVRFFQKAEAEALPASDVNDYFRKHMQGIPKRPYRLRRTLIDYWDALWTANYERLIWTLVYKGKRYVGKDPRLEGHYTEVDKELCVHCYQRPDGSLVPYDDAIREASAARGIDQSGS